MSINLIGNIIIVGIILILLLCIFFQDKILNENSILKKITEFMLPKKNSKEYKLIAKNIKKSYIKTDVKTVYTLKFSIFLIALLFSILTFFTNISVGKQEIFNSPKSDYAIESIYNDASIRKNNYNLIKKYSSIKNIKENDDKSFKMVKDVLIKYSNLNSDHINNFISITIEDILSIKTLYFSSSILKYIIFILVCFFIPDLILIVYGNIKNKKIEKETLNLTNLIAIVASNPNIVTTNILQVLTSNSYHLKELLQNFQMMYLTNKHMAYEKASNNEKFKPILKITLLLRQIEESNKESALKDIKNNNENMEKIKKISYENNIEKKEGKLLILFGIGALFMLKIVLDISINGLSDLGF